MSEPVTEAGRRLHDNRHGVGCWQAAEGCALIDLIAAIEAEARAASLDEGAPDRRWLPAALNVFAAAQEVRR